MVVKSVSCTTDLQNDENSDVSVVHFYADWSEECKHVDKIMEALSSEPDYNRIDFKKCAAESFPDISTQFGVNAVPTILFLKNGRKVDELTGVDPISLNSMIQKYVKIRVDDESLLHLMSSHLVVTYIRGNDKAMCALSQELLSIIKGLDLVSATTCDISANDSIKQKVETLSGSSSFPQLFIKGKFVGDLETVKRLNSTGELSAWIEGAMKSLNVKVVLKIKSLIKKSDIMVFMKGDRNAPRCGFSRQLMEILKGTSLPFETFDILSDEEVRQGLKVYSDWPTYPQVYVKGELVGGLDIIKSYVEQGDLLPVLRGEVPS